MDKMCVTVLINVLSFYLNFPKTRQTGETLLPQTLTPSPNTPITHALNQTVDSQLTNIPAGETHLAQVLRFRNYATLATTTTHLATGWREQENATVSQIKP